MTNNYCYFYYTNHILARREEDDPLPGGQDCQHEGGEVQPGHQGGVGGDEEVNRKYQLYYLTVNISSLGSWWGALDLDTSNGLYGKTYLFISKITIPDKFVS